jgi:A/G-specific adenine glycosylase
MDTYSSLILNWYEKNKRDLPWRNTKDAYKIWLSEIILQQTRVAQGHDYYVKFVKHYPTVTHLAKASEHEVLKLWQGLGYYSRARNMHSAAQYIQKHFKGKFPKDYQSIRALKGVGDYTAAAITSFAYGLHYPVLDGNVMRIYARYLWIKEAINSTAGKKKLQHAAIKLLPKTDPGTYNQAIMELGALCCTPKNPKCTECPLQEGCCAYARNLTDVLPVKEAKTKQRERHLNYVVVQNGNKLLIRTRTGNDIWKGLHDFPCIETNKAISTQKLITSIEWQALFGKSKITVKSVSTGPTHILSHQKLKAVFVRISLSPIPKKLPKDCFWINLNSIEEYAVPRLIERYIRSSFNL